MLCADLPDELVYWRAVFRVGDVASLQARIAQSVDPSELMAYVPNVVDIEKESQIKQRQDRDGRPSACRFLIDLLLRSTDVEWPDKFLYGLAELDQGHLVALLRNKLEEVKRKDGM